MASRRQHRVERVLLGGAAVGFAANVGFGAVHVVTEVESSALIAIHLLVAALVWTQLVAAVALAARPPAVSSTTGAAEPEVTGLATVQ